MHEQRNPRPQNRSHQHVAGIVYPQIHATRRNPDGPESPWANHVPLRVRDTPRGRKCGRHSCVPGWEGQMCIAGTRLRVTIGPGFEGMINVWTRPPYCVLYPEHDSIRETLRQGETIGGCPY